MSSKPPKHVLLDLLNFAQDAHHTLLTELDEAERAAIGTQAHWSLRDHIAHLTFWKHHLSLTLIALAHAENPPSKGDTQAINVQVFAEQRQRALQDILFDAEQAHGELIATIELFTKEFVQEQIFSEDREKDTIPEARSQWDTILRHGFWHPLEHFTQFYLDRNDVLHATQIQQAWANKVMQPELPLTIQSIGLYTFALFYTMIRRCDSAQEVLRQAVALNPNSTIQSIVLYNLASAYVTTKQNAKAQEVLRQALTLNPDLAQFLKQDPNLASLAYNESIEGFKEKNC